MASGVYDADFVLWTEQQAAALRRLRPAFNELDLEHLLPILPPISTRS